jgi:iron-sulfur cluster assembly protein
MAITLTETAANRVKTYLSKRGQGEGLRVGVRKTGCSGYAYVIDFADRIEADDQVFEDRGVKLIVNPDSLPFLEGSELDFVRQGLNESFCFHNPNVKDQCGCGESFNI